jgi:hypothetical protein
VGRTAYHRSNNSSKQTWGTVLHYKKEKTCLLVDIDMPYVSNFNTRETETVNKDKDLEFEVSRVRKVRTKIVPVIVGALGTIKKGLDQNLQLLPGHPSPTIELHKITPLIIAHIICKVLG